MNKVTSEADLLVLRTVKDALVKRYQSGSGQLPEIAYKECTNSQGSEGYALSINAYSGIPEQLKPVPSQQLIRVLRQGFKAIGLDITQMNLERHDSGESKAVFVSHELLEQVLYNVAVAGNSSALTGFGDAITQSRYARR